MIPPPVADMARPLPTVPLVGWDTATGEGATAFGVTAWANLEDKAYINVKLRRTDPKFLTSKITTLVYYFTTGTYRIERFTLEKSQVSRNANVTVKFKLTLK